VYDTKFDNGDIITQGFDPTTGLSEPIAAKPAEDPIDIPDTDSTGETRALIQNKSSQKDEELDLNGDLSPKASSTPATGTDNASTTERQPPTLDLSSTTTDKTASSSSPSTEDQTLELTDYDLILLDTGTTSAPDSESIDNQVTSSTSSTSN
jgi:hypothetical protein